MKRAEALWAVIASYLMVTASAVWMFGPYGLAGAGTLALLVLSFVNVREEDDDG